MGAVIIDGSITLTLLTALSKNKTYTYYAKQIDIAGNSSCSSESVDYELYINLEPTIKLTKETLSPSNNTNPRFEVSVVKSGATVTLHTDSECLVANKVVSGTASSDSIVLTITLSDDGTNTYYAKQVDKFGNISNCSSLGVSYELDTKASKPIIELSGISSSSNNTNPSFSVSSVEGGATISLHTDSECLEANKIASDIASSSPIVLEITLVDDGINIYYAKQVDKLGNISSCSDGVSYTLDTVALPPTLSLETNLSIDPTPTFSLGSLEIGGSVGLYSDDICNTLAQDLIEITEENMEIDLSTDLLNYETYTYSAKQTDSLGNTSDCSSSVSYEYIRPSFESVWRVGMEGFGDGDLSVTLPLKESVSDSMKVYQGIRTEVYHQIRIEVYHRIRTVVYH